MERSHRDGGYERLDDAALLSAVGLGVEAAAVEFVSRFQRSVFGVAITMCGDEGLAEDIAQTTFERAWRHADAYDVRLGSVRTWLLTICRRLAIDALRIRRSSPIAPSVIQELLPPSGEADPTEAAVIDDEFSRVRGGLMRLSEPQRRALLLATLGGHTAVEIAEIENIPVGTAKTRLRTGLAHLRDALDVSPSGGVHRG